MIARLIESARRGKGGLAVVEGPAGIGKTRIVESAIDLAGRAGLAVLRATCSEIEREYAFGVARQLFELALAEVSARERGRVLAGVAGRAPVVLGVELDPQRPLTPESAFAASHALFWLTANLATGHALLLAVDDAHWADTASLRYLHFLARRIADLPVALVVATRPPSASADSPDASTAGGDTTLASLIELAGPPLLPAPLSGVAVADLVRDRLGGEPDPTFVAACERSTDGNAFLLVELLRTLKAAGVEPTGAAARSVLDVAPDAVRRRLGAQLAALPAGATSLARALAVLGEAELPRAAAQAGIDLEQARRAARALEGASLLAAGRPLRFLHPVIAAGVTAGIAAGELADGHARAARLLAANGAPSDAVASHLLRTDPAGEPWTVEVLREAAAAAVDRGAPEAAAAYLRRAASEPPDPGVRAALLLELGRAETSAGSIDAALSTIRAGLAAGPDEATDAQLAVALSHAFDLKGDYEGSIGALDAARQRLSATAFDELTAIDHQLVAQALIDPAWRRRVEGRITLWQRDAQRGALADPVATVLACIAALAGGRPLSEWAPLLRVAAKDPGLRPYHTAVDINGWAFNGAVMALEWADCFEDADDEITAALADGRRRGDGPRVALLAACKARIAYRLGRLADAESWCRIGEGFAVGIEASSAYPFTLFDVLAEQGRVEEADELISSVAVAGGPENTAVVELMRGRVALAAGRHEESLERLLEAGEVLETLDFRHPNFVPWRAHAVAAAAGCGHDELARRLAEENLAISRRCEAVSARGRALRVQALVEASPADKQALLEESCAVLAGGPTRLDEAHSVVELGALLRAAGHRSAREWL
ncbi:MAG TPA: AAA family ATPase, partial [Acidimicrobiales bacterium]|nr:AAA family ATPase [Acidimicrobiales bacterium]